MSDDSRATRKSPTTRWFIPVLALALLALAGTVAWFRAELEIVKTKANAERVEDRQQAELVNGQLLAEIEDLKKSAAQREAQMAAQAGELVQREMAIAGREDAATERTQSSFQGLLIQQQLTKNLEALKASLPDLTPEVERLAREHAQFDAERQRLQKENVELRRKLQGSGPLERR